MCTYINRDVHTSKGVYVLMSKNMDVMIEDVTLGLVP